MSQNLKFIWIGKLKKDFWQEAASHYWERLSNAYKLKEQRIKEISGSKIPEEIRQKESEAILQKLSGQEIIISLDAQGKMVSSEKLAKYLLDWIQTPGKDPCFILGGSYGISWELKQKSHHLISFGPITLPNELARVVLLEQIYRAYTINQNHPYHH